MKKNLVQKFRKFYFALPKEEQVALYDIISAIRGEDNGSFTLKTYTTARVRGALFGISQKEKVINPVFQIFKGFFDKWIDKLVIQEFDCLFFNCVINLSCWLVWFER